MTEDDGRKCCRAVRAIPAITLAASLLGSAFGQVTMDYVSTVQGTSGLLGYWRFSSGAPTNSNVNGYTGTFQGNAQIGSSGSGPSLTADPANTPMVLDGNGDYLVTNLTGGIGSAGSVMAWVYLTTQPSTAGRVFQITAQAQSGNDFDFQIQTDNHTYFYTDSGSATVYSTALPLNTWVFLAATFTAGGARDIYLNGSLVATSTAGGHSATTNAFSVGENLVFSGRYFQGSIDEVAVFNRALSGTEVSNIYASALAVPEPSSLILLGSGLGLLWLLGSTRSNPRVAQSQRVAHDRN